MNYLNSLFVKLSMLVSLNLKNRKGQTLVEYALILVLIVIVVIASMKGIGQKTSSSFTAVNSALQ
jgi:Flp pilus assembly pilin Flp